MRVVVATGVFDIIHPGHVLYLEEARKLGDKLVVIVARDEHVRMRKGRQPIPEEQRLLVVKSLKPVDDAVLGDLDDLMKPIVDIKPDVIALGYDQDIDEKELEKISGLGFKPKVVRVRKHWTGGLNSTRKILKMIRGE
ncbi:MAG: FAD synthase [Candidatus Altiarchaeota archaeon]|nr:FAD synthase [Candidatus Altiarchaeota archaeon]